MNTDTLHSAMMNAETQPAQPARPKALITGASSGIGLATAKLIAQRGFETVLVARRKEKLESLAESLVEHAPSYVITADLADAESTADLVSQLSAEHPRIDLLINNAGFGHYVPFLDHTQDDHRRLMQIHYFTPVELIGTTLPGMLQRRAGQVINVASIAAKMGPWGHSAYAAAKAAIVSLTQSLAAEHADSGVHFSYVNPGIVRTEFFDSDAYQGMSASVKKHGIDVNKVAARIASLMDKPKLELCIPRHFRMLDWVKAISPTLAQRMVAKNSRPQK